MGKQTKKASDKKKFGTWFYCETCGGVEVKSVKDHLVQKHGLVAGTKGTKSMGLHYDGRDQYGGTNRLEFGGVVLTEEYHCKRDKDDMMRWA